MARKRIQKNLAYDDQKKLYYAYFDHGAAPDGSRLRSTKTYADREAAVLALAQFEAARLSGALPVPSRMTVRDWLDYWLEDVIRPNRAYTTYYCYWSMVKNHIGPGLGSIRLQALMPHQIQQYYTRMLREGGLSPNSVHKHHILLHTALKLAYQQGVISANPVDRVEPPKERPARRLYYNPTQLKALFRAAEGTHLELIVKLAGYLGLRRSEICGLRWEHVDLERGLVSVRLARTTAGYRVVEKEPKTDSSARVLGIGGLEDLTALLRETRRRQEERARQGGDYCDSGFVVTYGDGRPWHPNQVTREFGAFIRREGLPPITVHGLRHTFASVANSARVPMLDIGKALGHKDVSITGRIYTHIFDQTYSEVLSTVAACIRGA